MSNDDPQAPPLHSMQFQLALRRRGISDQAVLRAMDEVPRHEFVGRENRAEAYSDTALPIICGQTISQPFVVAYMTEQLRLRPHHRVLEIGAGSGYQAAVLSRLVREVITIERFHRLVELARDRLKRLGYTNVDVMFGDGLALSRELGRFDRILVAAALPSIPEGLIERLEPGGILIAPVGPPDRVQRLVRITRPAKTGSDEQEPGKREELIPVRFVPLMPGTAREL